MLSIITDADSAVLRKKAEPIKDPTAPEVRALITEMVEAMRESKGVGLAAPQVGKSIRLFVAEVNGATRVFINPVITERSESSIVFEEGCLSLPGKYLPVERAERVTVTYDDIQGESKTMRADGFLAIVIQHETDHLDGILMTDRYEEQPNKSVYAL